MQTPSRTTRRPQSPRLATCTMPPSPPAATMRVALPGAVAALCAAFSTSRNPCSNPRHSITSNAVCKLDTSCLRHRGQRHAGEACLKVQDRAHAVISGDLSLPSVMARSMKETVVSEHLRSSKDTEGASLSDSASLSGPVYDIV